MKFSKKSRSTLELRVTRLLFLNRLFPRFLLRANCSTMYYRMSKLLEKNSSVLLINRLINIFDSYEILHYMHFYWYQPWSFWSMLIVNMSYYLDQNNFGLFFHLDSSEYNSSVYNFCYQPHHTISFILWWLLLLIPTLIGRTEWKWAKLTDS